MGERLEERDPAVPRRTAVHKIRDDGAALRIVGMLAAVAHRVLADVGPTIKPPSEGMWRLGGMDRASYVWFLPCSERGPGSPAPVSNPKRCNHGFGVDRQHLGQWEVRAWAHGAENVMDVSLHVREVTVDLIEQAARMVGIPLGDRPAEACRACGLVNLPPCDPRGCLYPPKKKDEVET